MKVKRYEGGELRMVLTALVTDPLVCARVSSKWKAPGLFDSEWANLVGRWCIGYFNKYDHPVGKRIQDAFNKWAAKSTDAKKVDSVERFLSVLSDEYDREDPPPSEYILDVAGRLFNKVALQKAMEEAQDMVDNGEPFKAHSHLMNVPKIELGQGALVKVAEDYDAWRKAFDQNRNEQLITFPGTLNEFLGPVLVRESLVGVMAPDKCGKSMILWDMAYRAVRNRYRVAYFDAGDMGQDAVMQRMGCRAAKHPMKSGVYKWPTHIDEDGTVHYKEKHYQEGLSPQKAFRAMKKLTKGKDLLRLSCYPNSCLDISMISTHLTDWAREGWTADVLVVDYADILADPPNCEDVKDRIDTTWKLLRRLSQEYHCLVLTATQSNAAAYSAGQGVLRRQHFSGRKTKLAHANAIIGLNVSPEDKDRGVTRLNYIVRREGAYNESRYVTAAGCLAIYCPVMKSK